MRAWVGSASTIELAIAVLVAFVGLTVVSVAIGLGLERSLRGHRIWALPLDPGQRRHELVGNVGFVLVQTFALTAVLVLDVPCFSPPSWPAGVVTFVALMLGFQVYYYGLHRLLHVRALVRFHRWHHRSRVTSPLSGQSVGLVESVGWAIGYALLPALASHLVPISFEGWIGYLAFNVFGNIVGHANAELVPAMPGLRLSSLLSNTFVYHALHHARWTGHYSFQAAGMDRLCGTEWSDWPALHAEIAAGRPLTSLRETR